MVSTMTRDEIKESLSQEVQDLGLILQTKQIGNELIIMANFPQQATEASFKEAVSLLVEKLNFLKPSGIQKLKLYGKRAGVNQAQWQYTHAFQFAPASSNKPDEPLKKNGYQKPVATVSSSTAPASATGFRFQGLLIPLLLAGVLLTQVADLFFNTLFRKPPEPLTFEYQIESIPDLDFTETMNRYGAEGWELVFARRALDSITDDASYECIFKRVVTEATQTKAKEEG
jgi:hypothetical protein